MGQPVLGGSGRFCSGPGSGLGRGRPFGEPCGPTLTTGVLKVRSYSTVSRTRLQASLAAPCPCGWTTDSGVCLHSVLPGSPGRPPGIPPDQIRAGGPTPAPPPNEPRHPISIPEARPAPGRTLRVPELPMRPPEGKARSAPLLGGRCERPPSPLGPPGAVGHRTLGPQHPEEGPADVAGLLSGGAADPRTQRPRGATGHATRGRGRAHPRRVQGEEAMGPRRPRTASADYAATGEGEPDERGEPPRH